METLPKLPMDIIGYLADVLDADSHGTNWQSLKRLCLTCKFMVPICRRHLFADISGSLWQHKGFTEFLLSQPIITTHYVKKVSIDLSHWFSASDYDLLQKIHDSSSLTDIIISSYWMGKSRGPKLVALSLSLLQMPTLRCLVLHSVKEFPAAALSLCSGLRELVLHNACSLTPPSADNAVRIPTITTLVIKQDSFLDKTAYYSLMNPTGQNMVIPFDRLKNLFATVRYPDDFPYVCKLLERATCLERLELSVDITVTLLGLGSSLAVSPRSILRSITLDLICTLPLELNLELRQLSGKNVLEALEVKMKEEMVAVNRGGIADFDQLVTDVSAFPVLRQVIFGIKCRVRGDPDKRRYIPEITEAKFPQLLESTTIEFKLYNQDC